MSESINSRDVNEAATTEAEVSVANVEKAESSGNVFYIEEIDVVLAESMMTMRC